MPFDFSALVGLGGPQLPWLALAALGAGLVRGFAGFGAAMIFIPVASALIDPKAAVILLFVIDGIATLPLLAPAVRICRWSEIMPLIVGATLTVPLGVQALVLMDPVLLRWIICGAILLAVAAMATGWRYSRRPSMPVTVGIGGMAGLTGGAASLSGPPVVLFWLGGQSAAPTVRANMIVFLGISTAIAGAAYWWNGLFTTEQIARSALLLPVYAAAIWLGAHSFRHASESLFRRLAFGLIAFAALGSLPVMDGIF